MHNSWAGPAESLCTLSKLLLTALDDAAMGIPVVHTKPSMCVQACTHVRTYAHTCFFPLGMGIEMDTFINFEKPLTTHSTVKKAPKDRRGRCIDEVREKHAKSMFFRESCKTFHTENMTELLF